jgi:hypothetical protein
VSIQGFRGIFTEAFPKVSGKNSSNPELGSPFICVTLRDEFYKIVSFAIAEMN